MRKHLCFALTLLTSALRAQDRMRTLATNPRLIIPGHDPLEFSRFPTIVEIR